MIGKNEHRVSGISQTWTTRFESAKSIDKQRGDTDIAQALEMSRKLLGEEHPSVATSLNNLAGLYRAQGRYEEAEPLFEKLLGPTHPNTKIIRSNFEIFLREKEKKQS